MGGKDRNAVFARKYYNKLLENTTSKLAASTYPLIFTSCPDFLREPPVFSFFIVSYLK